VSTATCGRSRNVPTFELFVDDVEVSIRFYQAVLGLNPPPTYDPDGYVPVSDGAVTIGLQQHTALPPGHHFRPEDFKGPRGVGVEIVVEVNDVHAAFTRATDAVVGYDGRLEQLDDRPWGRTDFRVIDPDGYYVRVTS
jgi:lactoylglutathione lyase